MKPTHAVTTNGFARFELQAYEDDEETELRRMIRRLDGNKLSSLSLWAIPEGMDFDEVDIEKYPQEYVQTAGARDRMTAETREIRDGVPHQLVIGRSGQDNSGQETIEWGDGLETSVASNEVLTTDEVADIFVNYYKTGKVPDPYSLREISLQPPR